MSMMNFFTITAIMNPISITVKYQLAIILSRYAPINLKTPESWSSTYVKSKLYII